MGRDLTLYPAEATKQDLRDHLVQLGFKKCDHWWDWPQGTLNFSWFDEIDFRSIDGVSADVYPVSGDELEICGNPWALHVRNLYSASWHDVKMLNDVLRSARRKFGGTIRGDYGTNRYAPLWDDTSTPLSRGLSAVVQHVEQKIAAVRHALPDPTFNNPNVANGKAGEFIEFTNSLDPSRVIYNGLVPFAVAVFEYFFSRAFQVLLRYDDTAQATMLSHQQKIAFEDVLEIKNGSKTVEMLIAESYTFQNLDQLNKAYKAWLGLDVRALLYKRRKIGASIGYLENRVAEIIQYRHGVIHHLAIDRSLKKADYLHILKAIELAISEFIRHVEKRYGIQIERR
ncbi:hypothetical protein ACLD02_18020 [Alloalcanivorax sp. C16-2]|uniref:hypothetical protein n=1 Tax=Alloalcanivorax sp. C16-2 TaxID=3390052 RepID=UPI003970EB5D